MIVTKFGWLGLDPLRVPQAASMQLGVGDDFAQHLDAAAAANHDTPTESPVAAAPHRENEHSRAPEREAIASEPDEADGDTLATTDDAQQTPSPAAAQAAGMQPQQNRVMGESARRIPNGKDADSPLTPSLAADTTGTAGRLAQIAANARSNPMLQNGAAGSNAAPVGNGPATPNAATNLTIGSAQAPTSGGPLSAKAAVTGYRTINKQAVLLNEQARDSVFRQVLFKLGKDSGEMRVKLEPPEFGALDVRLQVDHDGSCRLSIGAERGDLAALLRQDMEPLKHALQQQGLQVTHAEVHTQQGSDHSRHSGSEPGQRASDDGSHHDDALALPRVGSGFVSAQGLDYWA